MFGIDQTPNAQDNHLMSAVTHHEAVTHLANALGEVGLEAAESPAVPNTITVYGREGALCALEVKHRSLVRDSDIPSLTRGFTADVNPVETVGVVVADRITKDAKAELRARGWGWLDLRGHLHLQAPGVFIDARVSAIEPIIEAAKKPLAGTVGMQLASLLLMNPDHSYGVREAATAIGRAPSSVSEEMARLRQAGLIDGEQRPETPELFYALAQTWHTESTDIATLPERVSPSTQTHPIQVALRLGLTDPEHEPGWALTDTVAAIAYQAPVSVSGNYPPDFYVPDTSTLRRARQLLGAAPSRSERAATLRVAPVPLITSQRVARGSDWPLAHPLFVALDLAQDPNRGTEVLAQWNPPGRWQRVW